MFTAANEQFQFTAIETDGTWPGREKHTQWPGDGPNKGKKGDPIFDAFYATQVETVISAEETQKRNQDAGAALLDKIGPAIVLTHSQSGPFGFADRRRTAEAREGRDHRVEPSGPPFEATIIATGKARAWGVSDIPMTYDPPVKDPAEIAVVREEKADGPDLFVCWMQKAPARQLVNLKGIPSVIIAAEASYHQLYDHCTAKYLTPGRHENRMAAAAEGRHPRQRPHGDDREEQPRDRQGDRRLGEEECEVRRSAFGQLSRIHRARLSSLTSPAASARMIAVAWASSRRNRTPFFPRMKP